MNRTNYQTDQRISYYASEGRIMELRIGEPGRMPQAADLKAKVANGPTTSTQTCPDARTSSEPYTPGH